MPGCEPSGRTGQISAPAIVREMGEDAGPRHVAALDGLRACAVLAVMGTHFDVPFAPGGQLGVDVFFVLSGFLIMGLIVGEEHRTGNVWWRGFFARRALRLLPALWLVGGATFLMVVITRGGITPQAIAGIGKDPTIDVVPNTFKEVGVAYFYVANFTHLFDVKGLFFDHAWSLAAEEQFYVLMPFLWLLVVRRTDRHRRWIPLAAIAGVLAALRIAGVVGWLGLVAQRIDGLFLGCAVALALADPVIAPRLRRVAGVALAPAAATLVALVVVIGPTSASMEGRFGMWLADAATALIVVALWEGRDRFVGPVLTLAPLVALGQISYGVYLIHLPVSRRISLMHLSLPGPAVVAIKLALTLALAAASYAFVERRALRLKSRFRPSAPVARAPSASS